MPITVELKGKLEPVHIEAGYHEAVNALNTAAANGKEFALFDNTSGKNIAISIRQILTITEEDIDIHEGLGL